MTAYDAVLFISFGGPEKPDDILPFLESVTRGRGIPQERLQNVAHHYEVIGGRSPINAITRQQAHALETQLKAENVPLKVYIGQRHWHPFLDDTLRQMAGDGVKRAVGFITAAHRSEASLERYIHAVDEARAKLGGQAPVIDYVSPWFDHPLFIQAIAERAKAANAPADASIFFTAHSIPSAMAQESSYVQELQRTADGVSRLLGRTAGRLAYSSRSGNPREPWLEPDVSDAIRAEAAAGKKSVFFIPIGFIADHVEILFDLDVEAKAAANAAGVALYRASSVGDHPLFVSMMAAVVRQRMTSAENRG